MYELVLLFTKYNYNLMFIWKYDLREAFKDSIKSRQSRIGGNKT